MKIKKAEIVEKVWGYEEYIANFPDSGYCGKKLHLNKGYRCSVHSHPEKDETFYIEKGRIYFELQNGECMEETILIPGNIVDIHDGKLHRFSGLEDSVIIEFSMPDVESKRKTDSEVIPDFENFAENVEKRLGGEK